MQKGLKSSYRNVKTATITKFIYVRAKVNLVRRKEKSIKKRKQIGVPHLTWQSEELCGLVSQ